MIKPESPAGGRWLWALSESFGSITACDLLPAVVRTTETPSSSIYHYIRFVWTPISPVSDGPAFIISRSPQTRCLIVLFIVVSQFYTYSNVYWSLAWQLPFLFFPLPDQDAFHRAPSFLRRAMRESERTKRSKVCTHELPASVTLSEWEVWNSWDVSMVNDQKMARPDGPSSRVSGKRKLATLISDWLSVEAVTLCVMRFLLDILRDQNGYL